VPGSILAEAVRQLQEYFAGGRREFDLPLDLKMGEFERRVMEELGRVPYGTTTSYGKLAAMAGHPGAARAVGNVMRSNQLTIVLPCHRVIGADGSLRGYGGRGAGLDRKRWLLELEGAIS
jgi:O-6-methylguanine DNA methyltransferase